MKKRKLCWHCMQLGISKSFRNGAQRKVHMIEAHGVTSLIKVRPTKRPGIPHVVHFGARMRKKLGLEYSPSGHLRSTLAVA